MANRRKMHVPSGTDDITVGTETLAIDGDGNVEAPDDAIGDLQRIGLTLVKDAAPPVIGMVRVTNKDKGASCSFDSQSYALDTNGTTDVPLAALDAIQAHGFEIVEDAPLAPAASPAAKSA
jgi:hypothetical protein